MTDAIADDGHLVFVDDDIGEVGPKGDGGGRAVEQDMLEVEEGLLVGIVEEDHVA